MQYGHLDLAVNNAAGESGISKPLHQFEEVEFDQIVAVNYKAVEELVRYLGDPATASSPTKR